MGLGILGGITYLHEAAKIDHADMWSETFSILRREIILVCVITSLLFWIGTLRTYMARIRVAELRKYNMLFVSEPVQR